jgi:hypothetical protein
VTVLSRDQVIAYVGIHAKDYNLDPAALLAVANGEGLNHPGSPWWIPGESGPSFGPPSWYGGPGGAGAKYLAQAGGNAQAAMDWAWSPAGLDAWMQEASQSQGVAGSSGLTAITNLVNNFERPLQKYRSGNITNARNVYADFQAALGLAQANPPNLPPNDGTSDPGGNPIVPVPPDALNKPGSNGSGSGGSQPNAPGGSQDIRLASIGAFSLGPFSTKGLQIGVPSGMVLGMLGMGLLALGALMFIAGSKGPMRFAGSSQKIQIVSASTAHHLP